MVRLAYFVSHPIQYQAPLLRQISADKDIELKVFFYSDFSLKPYQDEGFGQSIQWDVPLIEGYNYEFLDCWGDKQRQNWLQQPIAKNIYHHLKQGKFDAVWVHGWSWLCSLQTVIAAEKLGIPVLMRGESNGLPTSTSSLKETGKQIFLNWLFAKISSFLYIGTHNRNFYRGYGVEDKRLFSVPYAVDNEYFQQKVRIAAKNRNELRQFLNLQPDRPIILYAAKLIDVKRPHDLLAAYKSLSPDGVVEPEPYLLFVGDGNLRGSLEAEARATGWDSIRFLGFQNQSQMPSMYDLCDVFVLPSSFEPWGLAINEVMNAGKAVVVSDRVGCAADLIRVGENGAVFEMGNIRELANGITWGIRNAKSAGEASSQRIQTWSFNEDVMGIKASLVGVRK